MYEPKKMESYLRVNLLGPGPRLMKKRIYPTAVSQRLRNTALQTFLRIRCRRTVLGQEHTSQSFPYCFFASFAEVLRVNFSH